MKVLEVDVEGGKTTVIDEQSVAAMRTTAAATKRDQQPTPKATEVETAAQAGGRYWVYENRTHRFAKVHLADCSHCNHGRGTHGESSNRNGAWNGPYAARADAFAFAKSTGQPDVKGCSFCGPRSMNAMATDLKKQFHLRMLAIYDDAASFGYHPTYFLQMVQQHGGVQAANLLLRKRVSSGLKRLAQEDRLDIAVETHVLTSPWDALFTDDEKAAARWALDQAKKEAGRG